MNQFFAMGMFLPLAAICLSAGNAEATTTCPKNLGAPGITITGKSKQVDVVSYGKPLPGEADVNRFDTHVLTIKLPVEYELDVIECSLERPNEAPVFSKAACGKMSGLAKAGSMTVTFKQLPIKQGLNEFQVKVTAKLKDTYKKKGCTPESLGASFKSSWFVHTEKPDAPTPQYSSGGNAIAVPSDEGACNPVVVSLIVEHLATIHYQVGNGMVKTMQAPASSDHPPGYVVAELELQNTTLQAGEALQLTLWIEDHIRGATSTPVTWNVLCPEGPFYVITSGPPQKSYLTQATFHFSAVGGNAEPRCSCSNSNMVGSFDMCDGPDFHTCLWLQEGPQLFRIYAEGNLSIVTEYPWVVSAPDVHLLKAPLDGPDTTVVFEFETVRENGAPVPGNFWCSVDGEVFTACTSPLTLNNLDLGEHSLEIYAENDLGQGDSVKHSWEVQKKADTSKKDKDTKSKDKDKGCSAAGSLPLSLAALAGLWALRRRRS